MHPSVVLLVVGFCFCVNPTANQSTSPTVNKSFFQNLLTVSASILQSPTCGIRNVQKGEPRTETPWTAGIFSRFRNGDGTHRYQFFSSGVIIGASMILTISAGPYGAAQSNVSDSSYYKIKPGQDFVAAVGLKSTEYEDKDEHTQFSEVYYIVPYNGNEEPSNQFHFAIYHLKTILKISEYAREICLPRVEGLHAKGYLREFESSFNFQISGFVIRSNAPPRRMLKVFPLELQNRTFCDSAYKYHYNEDNAENILCAQQTFIKSVGYCYDVGSAITFTEKLTQSSGRTFLGAMLISIPKFGFTNSATECSGRKFDFFADIAGHSKWISINHLCSPNKFACQSSQCLPLSSVCNGIPECPEGEDENRIFCAAINDCTGSSEILFSSTTSRMHTLMCGYRGTCLNQTSVCNRIPDCNDGSDEDEYFCDTRRLQSEVGSSACDPIVLSPGTKATRCRYNGRSCNALDDQPLGSTISIKCKENYISKYRYKTVKAQCVLGGQWDLERPFACERSCGFMDDKAVIPWHVNFFPNLGTPRQISNCSGTLIEDNFVITHGDCYSPITWLGKDNYLADVGSTSSYHVPAQGNSGRKSKISRKSKAQNVLGDMMAILRLETSPNKANNGMPVCYSKLFSEYLPALGSTGVTAVVTNTATGTVSTETREVINCDVPGRLDFCINGTSNLNIGQGFFTERNGRYYLVGIVIPDRPPPDGGSGRGVAKGNPPVRLLSLNFLINYIVSTFEHEYR